MPEPEYKTIGFPEVKPDRSSELDAAWLKLQEARAEEDRAMAQLISFMKSIC